MKNSVILAFLSLLLFSCQKENDELVKSITWVNINYGIRSGDSNLQVHLMRGVFNDSRKGNIGKDTIIPYPGTYYIPATVLYKEKVSLFAQSTVGPDFYLAIYDEGGKLLNETTADSIIHYPITQLDTIEKWVARISVIPQ